MSYALRACVLPLTLMLAACETPDPLQELELLDLETYWVVGTPRGGTQYLMPAARFRLRHQGTQEHRSVQATAAFRREGEEKTWGSAWERVNPQGEMFAPGEVRDVLLVSDARYTSNGPIEGMLEHEEFVDANVDIFVRVGSSQWTRFAKLPVARRLGSESIEEVVAAGPTLKQEPAEDTPEDDNGEEGTDPDPSG
jgi:hypothetical protein